MKPTKPSTIQQLPLDDLEVVAFIYVYAPSEPDGIELDVWNTPLRDAADFSGSKDTRCDCCGSTNLKYACEVVHKPTGLGYHVGRTCATKIDALRGQVRSVGGVATRLFERAKAKRKIAAWFVANPQHKEIMSWASVGSSHKIAQDIYSKLIKWGSISEGQALLCHKLKAQVAERAAERAAAPQPNAPAPEGRVEVEGTVVHTKRVESDWGVSEKMLVVITSTLAKVWCSIPSQWGADIKGCQVRVKATWTRSHDDEFFSFGKRPTLVVLTHPDGEAV